MLIFFGLGCTTPSREVKKEDFFDKWRMQAEKSRGYSPSSPETLFALPEQDVSPTSKKDSADTDAPQHISGAALPQASRKLPTQPVTLNMHQVEVAVLLRSLARSADINLLINDNVTGKMNLTVKQAPWDQVFQSILRTEGLDFVWEGDMLRIVSPEDLDKELKQLEMRQKIAAMRNEMRKDEPLITRVIPVKYADAAGLKESLETFLTIRNEKATLGSIMVDEHTNSLVIHAIHNDLQQIIPLINDLDRPTRQILIEAHIVETTRDTARDLGVQWGGLSHAGEYWVYPGLNSSGVVGNSFEDGTIDPTSGMGINFPADLSDGAGMAVGFAWERAGQRLLALQLSALQEEGKLNILSSPSITTLDNQSALIESGAEVPFQTVEDDEVSIEFKEAKLKLEVTPHVIDNHWLKMKIVTNKDELDFSRTVQGNPTIITRKAQTNVLLFDGQTTVIGGLNQQSDSDTKTGVPVLSDIPLLGSLGKRTNKSKKMVDVLIFITPHILKQKPVNVPAGESRKGNPS